MTETRLKILLIANDAADAALIRSMLSQAEGFPFELEWAEALLPGLDRLAKGGADVVLIESGIPDCHGLDVVPALRMHAPAVPIVILSAVDSEALALRAVQIGAQDFLVKAKLEPDSLCRSLRYAIVRQKNQVENSKPETPSSPARIVGCLGAKGGVGTTTAACHTSLELKRQMEQRVLLADLNLSGGSVAFLTHANSAYTILDAANDLLRLDQSFWEKVVVSGPEGLDILPFAAPVCSEDQVHSDRVHYVLRFLRSMYPWIVLDLGRLSPFSASFLPDLTDLLLVTTFDLAAVTESRNVVGRLAEIGFESSRVRLIVNKVPRIDCVAAREVSKVLGIPSSAIVPESTVEPMDSRNGVRSQFVPLARSLAGLEETTPGWKRFPFLGGLPFRNRQLKIA